MSNRVTKEKNLGVDATLIDWVRQDQICEQGSESFKELFKGWVRKHAKGGEFGRGVCSREDVAAAEEFEQRHWSILEVEQLRLTVYAPCSGNGPARSWYECSLSRSDEGMDTE